MGEKTYDVIIMGSGPAGLQAAIHAARKKVSVLVMGRDHKSSAYGAHIENYCCMDGIRGEELLRQGRSQAEGYGTRFLNEDAVDLNHDDGWFIVGAESGSEFRCRASVLAMGISRKKLKVPGEKEFLGRGVSYCVECDANFFKGMVVAVAGCGSAAVSGAMTLLFYASDVYLVCENLDVSESLAEQVRRGAIHLYEGRNVKEITGKEGVESILLDDGSRLEVSGIFIELGAKGAVELAGKLGIELDSETMQYIATNKKQETNIPGLYAAGDICGPPWQVAKAVGEGCIAGIEAAGFAKKDPDKA
ncbi:MAG: NAD(P)/FAD-dependent oxidoreductase [Desulfobacterales bacterium]|nr:NAD(P)/FAD-dependent oxidoreductase [Desulfobacterales bacterium]MBL7172427.1 NAD(P)/FAD-dependent oxidoreductase [Desulfobacteraceae bacterium]